MSNQRPPNVPEDCWNHVGVSGTGECPELAQVIHCRNCTVFADGGRKLLDYAPSEDYRQECTRVLANPKDAEEHGAESAIVFQISDEYFALPAKSFREIISARFVHAIPHRTNKSFLGLINVRGELLLCMSLSGLLNIDDAAEPGRMLVLADGNDAWVVPARQVHGVQRFNPKDTLDAPATVAGIAGSFTQSTIRWREQDVGYLDAKAIFDAFRRSLA